MKVLLALVALLAAGLSVALLAQPGEVCIGGYTTSVAARSRAQRHNAQLALDKLIGNVIQPGQTFSFDKCVGTFSRDAGYRRAPVSYNGQLIDSWGGGVCQTSTTLYNAALLSGMQIVERNRHRFSPSYIAPGRDAAVSFSDIDLKFRNPYSFPVRILGSIDGSRLTVGIYGPHSLTEKPRIEEVIRDPIQPSTYTIGIRGPRARVRNTGKIGFQVSVFRITGDKRELISSDSYPSMDRVVQYK